MGGRVLLNHQLAVSLTPASSREGGSSVCRRLGTLQGPLLSSFLLTMTWTRTRLTSSGSPPSFFPLHSDPASN
jgi:hypothetical protein